MYRSFIFPALLLILASSCLSSTSSGGIDEAIGLDAPNFNYNSLTGEQISLSDFEGKVVYLFFYGAGCPHCRTNGPVTENFINRAFVGDSNFVALGLDTWNQSISSNEIFQEITGITYPLLLNAEQSLVDYYGNTSAYDRSVVVDPEGKIAYMGSAFVNTDVGNVVEVIREQLTLLTQ